MLEECRGALVRSTAADQRVVTRNAWHADSPYSGHAARNGCLGKNGVAKCEFGSSCAVIEEKNLKPALLIRAHEGVSMCDANQRESLLRPCQATAHQCRFNLTPMGCYDANDKPRESKMIAADMETPFLFNGRKVFQHARKHAAEEMENLLEAEIAAPAQRNLSSNAHL